MDITKFISPAKGLQMMKAGIEKNLGRTIDHFQVDYIAATRDISIKVWLEAEKTIRESYKSANKTMLVFMIESVTKSKLKENESLDIVSCEVMPDMTLNLTICLTRNGEKIKEEIKNYKP